eukprot:scaffold4063_cov178-Amphora_coffeaeformis.AAC.1
MIVWSVSRCRLRDDGIIGSSGTDVCVDMFPGFPPAAIIVVPTPVSVVPESVMTTSEDVCGVSTEGST